ncbi:MAG: 8-oxo-dGTP diphosphatase [Alphaproteobacteria bacterium]|nr:8-oxo-dGTP diphosphatase [Alphaproteobacteria bacterium]
MKIATLSIVEDVKNRKYVMIRHQRGINKGYINFPGGKKEEGESISDCVCRETLEETGLIIKNPVEVGYIEFAGKDFYVHIFKSTQFEGELLAKEDEVDVFWQDVDNVPYDQMRAADRHFLPEILSGKYVKRRYFYDENFNLTDVEDL